MDYCQNRYVEMSIGLEITSEFLQLNEVDTFLGLLHTRGFNKGEGNTQAGPPYGAWTYESNIINQGDDFDDHIVFLLSIFEPIKDRLNYYINSPDYIVAIRIFYRNNIDIASINIDSSFISRLSRLCNKFYISLIGDTEEDFKAKIFKF